MNYKITTSKIKNVLMETEILEEAENYLASEEVTGMLNEYDDEGNRKHWHYKNGVKQHEEPH